MATPPDPRPVRPRDAGTLILLRDGPKGPEVLMGRRPPKAVFIPDAFVFPGGKMDASDRKAAAATPLRPEIAGHAAPGDPNRARALAMAAIRETFEETGLLVAGKGDVGTVADPTWREMRRLGLAPALDKLGYVGRAITPSDRPLRFHARFFAVRAEHAQGRLRGNGELADLHWVPLSEADRLPLVDVTEFMVGEVRRLLALPARERRGLRPLFGYRRGTPHVRYL